jgi:hypothetical protein
MLNYSIPALTVLSYTHVQKKPNLLCSGCGSACGTLTSANGTLSDGSGSLSYSNSASCEWLITQLGAVKITILFNEFSTQPDRDFVRVFQCIDKYCSQQQQIAQLSGTYPVVQSVTSSTGFLKVTLTTDSSSSYDGFTASWTSVRACFCI